MIRYSLRVSRASGLVLLVLAASIWGVTFPLVKAALDDVGVFTFLALRFTLAAAILLPLLRGLGRAGWWRSIACGVALFAGYTLQTWGLVWTTPARSAFITALSVVLVPLVEPLVGLGRASSRVWGGALLALAGLGLLLRPEAGPPSLGDLLTVGCAVAFAAHVLLLQWTVRVAPATPASAVQVLTTAALALPLAMTEGFVVQFTPSVLAAVLVTAVLATVFAFWAMTAAQRVLTAATTAVVLSFEPVAAAVASLALGQDRITAGLLAGGALVVGGVLLATVRRATPAAVD